MPFSPRSAAVLALVLANAANAAVYTPTSNFTGSSFFNAFRCVLGSSRATLDFDRSHERSSTAVSHHAGSDTAQLRHRLRQRANCHALPGTAYFPQTTTGDVVPVVRCSLSG